jgi:hypothetical protein
VTKSREKLYKDIKHRDNRELEIYIPEPETKAVLIMSKKVVITKKVVQR